MPGMECRIEATTKIADIWLDVSFAARLLWLTLLAPDIVEAILMGEEPSGLSLTMLTRQLPVAWMEQRAELAV